MQISKCWPAVTAKFAGQIGSSQKIRLKFSMERLKVFSEQDSIHTLRTVRSMQTGLNLHWGFSSARLIQIKRGRLVAASAFKAIGSWRFASAGDAEREL